MMLQNRDLQILEKICNYCGDIQFPHNEYGYDYEIFCNSPTYRNAIALCLLQIGELVKKLSDEFLNEHTAIPWSAIRGMRNIVAHEYANIDLETIWETSDTDIIALKNFCAQQIQFGESQKYSSDLTMLIATPYFMRVLTHNLTQNRKNSSRINGQERVGKDVLPDAISVGITINACFPALRAATDQKAGGRIPHGVPGKPLILG